MKDRPQVTTRTMNNIFKSSLAILVSVAASMPFSVFGQSAVSPDGRNRIEYKNGEIRVLRDSRTLVGPQRVALKLDRGTAKVELFARNDGVAYRFKTDKEGEITVEDEVFSLVFPSPDTEIWAGYNWCDNPRDPKQDKLQHGCASI
jgi:hypothetical protein